MYRVSDVPVTDNYLDNVVSHCLTQIINIFMSVSIADTV